MLNALKLASFLLLVPGILSAQNSFSDTYKSGDKLCVYSQGGLSLREEADAKGKLIVVAPYGDEVVVAADDKQRVPFTSSNISGTWVKVQYKEKTGYMFDGFLSRLKAMPVTTVDKALEGFEIYLKSQFQMSKETKTPPEKIYVEYYKMDFANDVTYEHKIYEGGATIITSFPLKGFTFQEVFLLARIAYPEFFGQKNCDYNTDHVKCDIDDGLTSLEIKKEGNFIVLVSGSAD